MATEYHPSRIADSEAVQKVGCESRVGSYDLALRLSGHSKAPWIGW
jgi:hypothetical protein